METIRISSELAVRAGTASELATFAAFWLAMFEEAGVLHERDLAAGWRDRFCTYLAARIAANEGRFFVAVDADLIVGTAGAIVADGYPFVVHGIKRGYIFGVRVAPDYRGRGMATQLTQASIAFLRETGCEKIRLHASPYGRPIYERLGFVPTNEMQLAEPMNQARRSYIALLQPSLG